MNWDEAGAWYAAFDSGEKAHYGALKSSRGSIIVPTQKSFPWPAPPAFH
jgi:hypothetical protein